MALNHKTTKEDMETRMGILPYRTRKDIPISFIYDGKKYEGFTDDMNPRRCFRRLDSNLTLTTVTANLDCLEIRVEYIEYKDFPVTEWVAFFENTSKEKSKILSDFRIGTGVVKTDDDVALTYSNGDDGSNMGYEYFENDLKAPFVLHPNDTGCSCAGASPFMRLHGSTGGINIAVGWTGTWIAEFEKVEGGVKVAFGQKRCHMVLNPGEVMRTPRVNFEGYVGDEAHGRNMWRRFFMKHICVKDPDGHTLPPKLCMHVFNADGFPEFTGATEENQLRGIRSYIKEGVKPDIWWIDAGWYVCGNHEWPLIGTWEVNKANFPNGLAPIGEECKKNDIQLLLWFEPERVVAGTWLDQNHPEWLLRRADPNDPNILFNYANPEALEWMTERINKIIKESGVNIYRQDFNYDPRPSWEFHETEDRIGAIENLHIQGYYKLWDEIILRNPGLWIDSCASGGRRNDPETLRRAVPLHYTDVEYGVHPVKQKQHRYMFEWIPYFRAHNMSWDNPEGLYYQPNAGRPVDEFAYQAAMAPALTDMIEWNAPEEAFDLARHMHPIWRRAAAIMTKADYYPLTVCRKNPEDYYAMEFYNPDECSGFFQVLRNTQVKEPSFTAKLTLDETKDYKVENTKTGETKVISGKELAKGIEITLDKRSAAVVFFEAIKD